MSEKKYLVFVDAESDGLYGSFISVAMKVIDYESGEEIDEAYYGMNRDVLSIKDVWTKENVEPYLGDYCACNSEENLLEKVWEFWEKYKDMAYAIGDVIFPVESRLFEECVKRRQKERMFVAPFPLLDLSSMLLTKGIDPNVDREGLIEEVSGTKHNAAYDVKVSIQIWKKYFRF